MLLALRRIVDGAARRCRCASACTRGRAVRGRHRPALPPHLHGDGRRRQPRGAADGARRRPARALRDARGRSSARARASRRSRSSRSRSRARRCRSRRSRVGRGARPRAAARRPCPMRFPLIGRDARARRRSRARSTTRSRGRGRLIELVSEPGMGRSRLMEEVRDRAEGVRVLHATCEPYTAAHAVRDLARAAAPAARRAPGTTPTSSSLARLRAHARARRPERCCRGCRCSAIALDVDVAVDARGRPARARVPRRAAARGRAALHAPPAARAGR